ncbi:hypothetical protein OJ998_19550 [Solirubrobacter taibaiensis]|nr:hypothetical protein [Solirubrobacter taibaiensis]
MKPFLRVVTACAVVLWTLASVAAADAAVKASAKLVGAGDAIKLEVAVTSSKAFTTQTRPKSVKVGSLALKRVAVSKKAATFRSGVLAADAATKLSGSSAAFKVKSGSGTKTMRAKVAPAPAVAPVPGPAAPAPGPAAPAPAAPATPPAPNATRNDAAGQSAMTGDLMLEWYSYASSGQFAEYRRIWLLSDGTFRLNVVDWNTVSGEKCRTAIGGSWTFKEGWTSTEKGGLVLVKVTLTTAQGSGDEVLTFANADPNAVYIGGASPVRYERNPQINNNCG